MAIKVNLNEMIAFVVCDGRYSKGNARRLLLVDEGYALGGAPLTVATVNAPEKYTPAENEVLIKNYAENQGVLSALIRAGVVEDTGITVPLSNYVDANVCRLTVDDKQLDNEAVIAELEERINNNPDFDPLDYF